ncbi:hypothetical protein ACX84U_35755, partial [Burkholderia pseudomallei]
GIVSSGRHATSGTGRTFASGGAGMVGTASDVLALIEALRTGGGEQIGAHRVRERARRDAGRGARLLEERHVAGGGAQAGDHGGPRSTNGQRGSKRPRAPAPEANARGDRTAVRCAAGND